MSSCGDLIPRTPQHNSAVSDAQHVTELWFSKQRQATEIDNSEPHHLAKVTTRELPASLKMRVKLVVLICLCLIALSVAKKGKKKSLKQSLLRARCEKNFELCKNIARSGKFPLDCRASFNTCKQNVKRRRGKKRGGSKEKGPSSMHGFCHCFKKLVGFIKKHHNKTKVDSDGHKITVHEKVLNIAQSALLGPKRDFLMVNGRIPKMEALKECFLRPFYCHSHSKCRPKKGGKRGKKKDGKKAKRRNRGIEFMFGKSRRHKTKGRQPWDKTSLYNCLAKATGCKVKAMGRKKHVKACAKAFFKCVQDECNKA